MGTPMHITDAADLYDPSIQKMFIKSSTEAAENFRKYVNIETGVEDYIVKDSSLTGLGTADRTEPENAAIAEEAPVQGYDKSFTQVEYGKVLPFTKRMWKFGIKKRDMTKITRELKMACIRKREKLFAERLDNGWDTSYTHTGDSNGSYSVTTTGGDSAAMYYASHTREDGGTVWNNIVYDGSTYNMDWDYDAIKASHRTAALIKDGKGNPCNVNLDTYIFMRGSSIAFRAQEIIGAIRKSHKPGSADYDGSGVMSFNVIELPYLTNSAYWYSFDSSMKNETYGLQYLESQGIELEGPNVVFKTNEIQYKSTVMFAMGHNDARNSVGSKGTNAA